MEVRIYDAEMMFQGLIENQTSVMWNRKYYEPGDFQINCPSIANNMDLLKLGRLIWMRGAAEAGVIESIRMEQNAVKNDMVIKGRFLSSYMTRRLIRPTYTATNKKIELVMRELLTNAEAIPLVQLGSLKDYSEVVTMQATYKNLQEYETKLAKAANIGYRFRPDFTNKTITFELYRGVDRSVAQTDVPRVIFAQTYNNINSATYEENDQLLKTVCYVGGEGEGTDRIIQVVGDDTLTGLERRELFLNASDARKEDGMTDAEYRAVLTERGTNALNTAAYSQSFECVTEANGTAFVYKTDYDLGDVVTVTKENWGVSANLRITGLTEVYEYGAMKVSPVFGTPLPEKIDWKEQ
ncbi:MAG: siphovirus ReqiPepy6 Gp37-like family protein [Solobacterium sp.]|nr:siphovirus ReqiPepy6 Gp37-like family protein [Solobacterium sp.]